MTLGLRRGTNQLIAHQDDWKERFEEEKQRILSVIDSDILDIQHIGSTAIPTIPAKPILDIAVGVASLSVAEASIQPMATIGYEYFGEHNIPEQRLFVKGDEAARTHYIHFAVYGEWKWNEYLFLRDYLLAHPDVAQEYGQLKVQLVARFPEDRQAYIAAKTDFIKKIIEQDK